MLGSFLVQYPTCKNWPTWIKKKKSGLILIFPCHHQNTTAVSSLLIWHSKAVLAPGKTVSNIDSNTNQGTVVKLHPSRGEKYALVPCLLF